MQEITLIRAFRFPENRLYNGINFKKESVNAVKIMIIRIHAEEKPLLKGDIRFETKIVIADVVWYIAFTSTAINGGCG